MRKIVAIDGIGDVLFERSTRARSINISIRSSRAIRVAVPVRVSFKHALAFFHDKSDWVRNHLKKFERIEKFNDSLVAPVAIDKKAASKILIPRLAELAQIHAFQYCKVSLRAQRTRWGSCSPKNNISLNIRLATLPQELMDYVLLHELTHTKIKNHSKKFWALLEKQIPNAKALNKQLRKYTLDS